jgi:two-component system chemotaxis response regulator CheB
LSATPVPWPAVRVLLLEAAVPPGAQLATLLGGAPGLEVVGQARSGEAGLQEVARVRPDAVVLDLESLRLEGFAFLRLLMPRRPTPVVVVASASRRGDVFRALELGALDFVVRPVGPEDSLESFRDELVHKCAALRTLRLGNLIARRPAPTLGSAADALAHVVAVGASTGGPQAVQSLLAALPRGAPLAILVAQHMPEKFTATFADRLRRTTALDAREAADGDAATPGRVLVAPGGHHMELRRDEDGKPRVRVLPAEPGGIRYTPSIDRLFTSVADASGPLACAVVLTGMGHDGRVGVQAIKRQGGLTLAESADTAVVYGMPQAAAESGAVDEVLALGAIADRLLRFARGG